MACHPDAPFTAAQEARIVPIDEIMAFIAQMHAKRFGIKIKPQPPCVVCLRATDHPSTRTCARSACPGAGGRGRHSTGDAA